jgi:hypothetical protein
MITQLTLVVRNDGNLQSLPMTLADNLPDSWVVLSASASKGLVSYNGNQLQVRLGAILPDEQIIVVLVVRAPDAPDPAPGQQCVTLSGDIAWPPVCAPLPDVQMAAVSGGGTTAAPETAASPADSELALSLLGSVGGQPVAGRNGGTLVVNNGGKSAEHNAYVHVQFGIDCRLSDALTTMGLVSVVDHTVVVRLGRLDPGSVVAVTLVGQITEDSAGQFCATLVADGQVYRRECGRLTAGQETH